MKTHRFLAFGLFMIGLLLGSSNVYAQFPGGGGGGATNLPLIASTDFTVIGGEDDYYHSFDMQNDFGGIVLPTFNANFKLPDSTGSTAKTSTVLDNQCYALTPNPVRLDSLRFADNEDSGEWGVIISNGGKPAPKTPVFSMNVIGLKNNGNYRVVVEVCNPHSTSYLNTSGANKKPHLTSGYSPALKIGVNNSQFGGKDARPGMAAGSCSVIEITNPANATSDFGPVADNKLSINFYIQQMNAGEAIMIKNIKVYGELDPKISGPDEVCAGGESGILSLAATYQGCKYQWYCDGKPISGATKQSYAHVSEKISKEETHEYYIEVTTPDGKKVKSNVHKLTDAICCTSDDGEPMSQKLIWQDDFGTFTGKGQYWIWDYSDINNPVKVKKTAKGWTYGLSAEEEKLLAASYPADGIPYGEGTYSIAANVTCSYDGVKEGTMWDWQAQTFNGQSPKNNGYTFAPDHTYGGSAYGAMLFLNCGNEANATIYERTITNLCNKEVTVKCYLNNWSGSENPTEVYIRITDLNSQTVVESQPVKRYSISSGLDWIEVKKKINLTGTEPKMKFEIISKVGGASYNEHGNDLLLDDIQIWTCTPPSVQLYFDDLFKEDTTSCSGEDVDLLVNVTKMITNFYKNEQRYIFQYTTGDPEDNSSWKPVPGSDISSEPTLKDMSAVFDGLEPDDKIYFRVVLGSKETLEGFGLNYAYNPSEACANYTVSEPIVATVKCDACTEPLGKIKIVADKDSKEKKNKKDVIHLCFGESVTLSQAKDITPAQNAWASSDFEGFAIKWFEAEKPGDMIGAKSILNDVIADKVISYDDESLGGTEMSVVLNAVDALYLDGQCKTADTMYIMFDKKPDAKIRKDKAEFCEGEGEGEVNLDLTEEGDYSVLWWHGADTLTGTPLSPDLKASFFEGLEPGDGGTFSYQLVDNETGCKGEVNNYELTINANPEAPKDEKIQYTINGNNAEPLSTEKFSHELDETMKLKWYTSGDKKIEPNSKGESHAIIDRSKATETPYVFYIAYQDGYCFSERAKVEVEVLAAPAPSVKDIDLCKDGDYDANDGISKTDDGYDLIWFRSATDTAGKSLTSAPTDVVDVTKPGKYTLYVAQRAKTSPYAQSEVVSFDVTVYDVKAPEDASRHEYCANDKAEELKGVKVQDEKNYFYADEIVFVYGTTEQSTFTPDTKKQTTQKYEYSAYQKFTTPESKKVCSGPSIEITVDVVAVSKPVVTQSVSYVKSEAQATKEFVDILVKAPDAVEKVPGQTMLWSKEENGVYVKGSTSSSKPTYDPLSPVGEVEKQVRWVKWEAETENGLVCQSDPEKIDITISSTPAPIVKKIEICEEVFKSGVIPTQPSDNAIVNDNDGKLPNALSYELVWFDNQSDADNAMTGGTLSLGKTSAPTLEEVFSTVDMTDETASEWTKSLYVVQTYNGTTSPASEMKLVVNATPKLQAIANEPVCDGPVNLTDNKYWNVSNGVTVEAEYSFEGGSVSATANSLTKGGKYEVVGTSSLGCVSETLTLQLDIRKLAIEMNKKSETCPGDNVEQEVKIDFTYNKEAEAAKKGNVKLTWTSDESVSTKPTQNGVVKGADETSMTYTSGDFDGKAGDSHTITVEMTDGYCVASTSQKVEIGNGPAGGTYAWSEAGNKSATNGKNTPLTDANKDKIEIYACGQPVSVDFSNVAMDNGSEVEWFKTNDYSSSPAKSGVSPTFGKNEYGTYYVRYMNHCYAYATVKIIDASVTISTLSDGDVVKCEKDDYKAEIDVDSKAGTPVREWYKDGEVYRNNSDELSFSPLMKKDEGEYKVEYRYEGCWAELPVVNLKVKEYVKVDVADYEMYDSKKSYIIIAGDDANVEFKFSVPTDPSPLKSTLTDKASRNKGTVSSDNAVFGITGVDEDHQVKVEFESDDYCSGGVEFQVLRDAKLIMHANVDTAMCLTENKPFTIDTIGTGLARRAPGIQWKVTAIPEKGSETQEKGFTVVMDTLKKNVSPRVTTKYKVEFTYGEQRKDTTIKVTVYDFKVEPVHQTICSGEEIMLKATVTPAGSKIEWFDKDKTTSLGENPGMLSPVFDGGVSQAKSTYIYWARPYSDLVACKSSEPTPLKVEIYRPLEGEIEDKTICEGESVRIDAGSYGATKYVWIVKGDTIPGNRYFQDTPTTDTEYYVHMTRGEVCEADDKAVVTVKSNPVIESIDSFDVREVDIVMAPDFGTPTFRYSIDGGEWTENTHLSGLSYSVHTIKVEDANGCVLLDTFVVNNPVIEIPYWFSPNGDGDFDKWTVPGIKDTYPEAEFTIFDRWGKKLVEFKGEEDGWDGTYNGVDMPSTDYWYELIVREIDKVYTGHFTLIRR